MSEKKEQFGSSFGFRMAAVGSAVGLGNLWGFPYKMGKSGGFIFLIMYIVLAILIGYVIMVGELSLGRKSGSGVLNTYKSIGKKYWPLGWMAFLSPMFIMTFYSVLGGYCLRYTIANIGDMFGGSIGTGGLDSPAFFSAFTSNMFSASAYTIVFMLITVAIIMGGVSGGIEKFTKVAMPALFVMLVIVIIRSLTLPGASAGLAFMFKPSLEPLETLGFFKILATAGGQMFFSLSLGMGIMLTYGAYLPKKESIEQKTIQIIIADTVIAIMAGLAIMPAVFAMGLEPAGGPGLLFVTLQAVFNGMGAIGPLFGFLFYLLVFIAALTSSISIFEVGVSVCLDFVRGRNKEVSRKKVSVILGLVLTLFSLLVAIDGLGTNGLYKPFGFIWLEFFDLLSEGIMMPLGALCMSVLIGWKLGEDYIRKEVTIEGNRWTTAKFSMVCYKFIAPLGMILVLYGQLQAFGIIG